jgi:arabinose-5-phosphate isomerase
MNRYSNNTAKQAVANIKIDFYQNAKRVILEEADALNKLAENLPDNFDEIVEQIIKLKGRLILSGIGKSGYIAHKIAASFSSTGTPALFIHPAEASHGDLGMIAQGDMVFLLSNSGETRELTDIINYCKRFNITIVAITMNKDSNLAKYSDYLMLIPKYNEASSIDAPTTSCSMMLALGDALMVTTHEAKGLTKELFKSFHPGGKIGASLRPIASLMHKGSEIPIASPKMLMPEVLIIMTQKSFGCCAIVENDELVGIITDGDLRRHIDQNMLQFKAEDIMSLNPKILSPDVLACEALKIMNEKSITNFLIVENNRLVGIVHIHDLLRAGVT